MDDNVDRFGRDSDSDSASSEASTTENAPFPGGGAAGGFQGLVQGAIVKRPEAGSGIEEGGATLRGAVARDDGSDEAPPVEGKEEVVEGSPGSPPPSQGGAQPKKTLPRPAYEGKADALVKMLYDAGRMPRRRGVRIPARSEVPDIAKVRELLDAGIDVLYQVRVPCACGLVVEY
jgi:hypothetical protein